MFVLEYFMIVKQLVIEFNFCVRYIQSLFYVVNCTELCCSLLILDFRFWFIYKGCSKS